MTPRVMRVYNAGSSECFGNCEAPADENTPLRPRSPYAVAKATAYWLVANYREAYGLFACTGILFNHESPLRPERFVTRKIVSAACAIANGSKDRLILGNIGIIRDWGWAPEYVDAMWRMLQRDRPDDFVVATGQSHKLLDFLDQAFREVGLEWKEHVDLDKNLHRPADIDVGRANPGKARAVLGWSAQSSMADVVKRMITAERGRLGQKASPKAS